MNERYSFSLLTDWDSISRYEPFWRSQAAHPNVHPDFFRVVVGQRIDVEKPVLAVISTTDEAQPCFLGVGRIESVKNVVHLGYLPVFASTFRQLTFIRKGLMGTPNADICGFLVLQLRKLLDKNTFQAVNFAGLEASSPFWTAIRRSVPFYRRDLMLRFSRHWTAKLPGSWKEYSEKTSAKHRSYLRRCEKKIGTEAGGTTSTGIYVKEDDIGIFCKDAEAIACRTYHRGIGAGFVDSPEIRARLSVCARNGWMRGYVLYANKIPVAFWLGTQFGTTFHLEYTGYLPQFSGRSPGLILYLKMIEHLYTTEITAIDFGQGDAIYKQRYGDAWYPEADALIYAPKLSLYVLIMAKAAATMVRRGIELVAGSAVLSLLKKLWRKRSALSRNHS